MTVTDYPTFSDSPFFYDRRSASLPELDQSTVQVSLVSTREYCAHLSRDIALAESRTTIRKMWATIITG